uniref:Uncharacterized protein n=1 Tax=Prymnesium polylepis TaxID=72548 RepID=A0A7S4JH53_9EUKA|mmetsp:Transcript_4678/g.10896  ORF Transcript_4678/g.10896 Transcript_4678/m.10896 type:complete len:140 (+) Transcript_4678:79-498(+)|eukprot:6702992-Prymnesium_polylepis.1
MGIEAVIAARRSGAMPSKEELQQRTAALVAKSGDERQKPASVDEKERQQLAELMSVEALQKRCDEIVAEGMPAEEELLVVPAPSGGSLLHGSYDEAANAASFADALAEWRGESVAPAARPSSHSSSLGDRLLAKRDACV